VGGLTTHSCFVVAACGYERRITPRAEQRKETEMGQGPGVTHLLKELLAATERLAATVKTMAPEDLGRPSLLPGWTRAHVLTHIARNADGTRNLLLSVRSGHLVRMYASSATRAADIDAGAG